MEIYVNKLFPYFPFFWFSNMILSDALILPVLQRQHSEWERHKLGHI